MRLFKIIAVITAISAVAIMPAANRAESKAGISGPVRTLSGPVSGTTSSNGKIAIYHGIPYAASPVSDLRWKAPQPVKPWKTILNANNFGASCMRKLQRSRLPWTKEFMTQNEVSEDRLTLNVWTPASSPNKKLPVFVWIHGGGFSEGSSEVPVFEGTELARTGMVVVTLPAASNFSSEATFPIYKPNSTSVPAQLDLLAAYASACARGIAHQLPQV